MNCMNADVVPTKKYVRVSSPIDIDLKRRRDKMRNDLLRMLFELLLQ
jgi:hypothetical protein